MHLCHVLIFPNEDFGRRNKRLKTWGESENYAPQTTIVEGRTNLSECASLGIVFRVSA